VSAYEHAMRERSRLLRDGQAGRPADPVWLNTLEDTMATRGIAVAAARRDIVLRLDEACVRGVGPFPAASLRLIGDVPAWLAEMPALEAEDRLRQSLATARRIDAMAGGAAVGPHRDDLDVRHRAKGLPAADCSTGEQKAVLIAIVLADARLQAAERGTVPLLLLDEVVAHLDDVRRHALFDELVALNAQAWMTGTDAALFAPLGTRAQRFTVADATVSSA
jgi:DNA replication and repair protein RecF